MDKKELKVLFQKNQKKIDNRKTTKEDRKQLIQENKNILKILKNL